MATERFVCSDRLEEAVAEMHEGMRHFAHDADLKIGRGREGVYGRYYILSQFKTV
jgi:hypothetical protein